jgi:cytochrome c5
MSDPKAGPDGQPEYEPNHEGPVRTPQQLVWTIVASFVVPIIIIILLVNYVAKGNKPAAGSDAMSAQAIAQRLMPVGSIEVRDLSDPASVRTGEQVYLAQCTACHAAGLAGAPKTGDTAAWAARVKTGYDALYTSVLKGKGAMGAQGGGDYSDFEIARAVVYLANKGGASFEEPKAPAAPAAAASAPK